MPTSGGTVSSSFVIQTDGVNPACPTTAGAGSNLTVKLTGTGTQAGILVVNPTSLEFGSTLVGTTQKQSVMLSNASTAQIDSITCPMSGFGIDPTAFTVDNCPTTLAAGASIPVDISFTPFEPARSSTWMTFNGSDGETVRLDLQGEPVARALLLSSSLINFGYVPLGASVVECVTVSNAANRPFAVDDADLNLQDGGAFALSASDDATPPNPIVYPLTIAPGDSAKICYSFAPSIAQHLYDVEGMLVNTDPTQANSLNIEIDGWGGGPQITCLPKSVDFGPSPLNDVQSVPVTCTNTGTVIPGVTLTIGSPTTTNLDVFTASFDPTINPYPAAGLAPGQSAQVDAIYLPTTVESDTGTLVIPSNGGQGQGVSIPLSGQGTN